MNVQSIVVVILRLMAIVSVIDVFIWAGIQLIPFTNFFTSGVDGLKYVFIICLSWLLLITIYTVLWFLAVPLARLITRGIDKELKLDALSPADCYTIAFAGIGLFYGIRVFPQVVYWSYDIFKDFAFAPGRTWKENIDGYQTLQAFVPFAVSMLLLFKGRSFALMLAARDGNAKNVEPEKISRI